MICKTCFQDEAAAGYYQCRFCIGLGLNGRSRPNKARLDPVLRDLALGVAYPNLVANWGSGSA